MSLVGNGGTGTSSGGGGADGPVVAALLLAAVVAIGVAWWAKGTKQAPDEAPSDEAAHEPGMIEGPPGDAPLAPAHEATEVPAADAPVVPSLGEPDAATADAALAAPEAEPEEQPAPAQRPIGHGVHVTRELGTRGTSGPRGDSPVRARVAGDETMPVPMQVAPPRPTAGGPLRAPPRPDPSPILRPRAGQ